MQLSRTSWGGFLLLAIFLCSAVLYSLFLFQARDNEDPPVSFRIAEEQARCGVDWQTQYYKLHADILGKRREGRYLVYVPWASGAADRLNGLISAFLFALLSDRALQITDLPGEFSLDEALLPARIEYHRFQNDPDELRFPWARITSRSTNLDVDGRNFTFISTIPKHTYPIENYSHLNFVGQPNAASDAFVNKNLKSIFPQTETIFLTMNRGMTISVFQNRWHRKRLLEMGLRPENLFSCAFHFLFRPSRSLFEGTEREFEIMSNKETLKIGIQIRAGDDSFHGKKHSVEGFEGWFECAEQIERSFSMPHEKVVWYLVTDSASLRLAAAAKYPKVVTNVAMPIEHVALQEKTENSSIRGFRFSYAELMLFSLADFHIISNSGYGKVGAFIKQKPDDTIFQMAQRDLVKSPCRPGYSESLAQLSSSSSGI